MSGSWFLGALVFKGFDSELELWVWLRALWADWSQCQECVAHPWQHLPLGFWKELLTWLVHPLGAAHTHSTCLVTKEASSPSPIGPKVNLYVVSVVMITLTFWVVDLIGGKGRETPRGPVNLSFYRMGRCFLWRLSLTQPYPSRWRLCWSPSLCWPWSARCVPTCTVSTKTWWLPCSFRSLSFLLESTRLKTR